MFTNFDHLPNEIIFQCVHYLTGFLDLFHFSLVDSHLHNVVQYVTQGSIYQLITLLMKHFNGCLVTPGVNKNTADVIIVHYSSFDPPLILKSIKLYHTLDRAKTIKCFLIPHNKQMLITCIYTCQASENHHYLFDGTSITECNNQSIKWPLVLKDHTIVSNADEYNCTILSKDVRLFYKNPYWGFQYFIQLNAFNYAIKIKSVCTLRVIKYQPISHNRVKLGLLLIFQYDNEAIENKCCYYYSLIINTTSPTHIKWKPKYRAKIGRDEINQTHFVDLDESFVGFQVYVGYSPFFRFYQKIHFSHESYASHASNQNSSNVSFTPHCVKNKNYDVLICIATTN